MGEKSASVWIVIPAFDEQASIGKVISGLKREGYKDIIVVDDGSSDQTYGIAEAAGAKALRHIVNRGQGAALKTGIDYALHKKADIIVTFDADGQFLPSEIKDMVGPVMRDEADITIGSRFMGTAKDIPLMKKLVLKLGIIVVLALYRIRISDSQNGFRAMNRKAAERIEIKADRMEHAGEILGEIAGKKLRYREIPVTVLYTRYSLKRGQSWTRSFSLGVRMLINRILR